MGAKIATYRRRVALAWRVLRGKGGQMTVTATLIRKDGTQEDLGVLAKGAVDMKAVSKQWPTASS